MSLDAQATVAYGENAAMNAVQRPALQANLPAATADTGAFELSE
jgi:hypothetical protein